MKILVVGGAGYVGGAVTDLLLETNHETRVYDSLLYEESYRNPVDCVTGLEFMGSGTNGLRSIAISTHDWRYYG